ncbi:MAG TPA: excinuclease ABC subunit UvrC [Cytophagales bacterium]|nr:excinuclease ABC subunit UvrC [Cytophagales bacterium]
MSLKNSSILDLKLPNEPGIYKFFNIDGILIYVGKAKNIKNRVSSYFNKGASNTRKTLKLVSEIAKIEFTIVNSEFDALLLENSLIKKHQPKYNIQLKDDKSYPYILITNEPFPKIYATRVLNHDLGTYYGPYASVKAMNNVLEFIRKLYTIRTCNLNLSDKNINEGKFKVCLEYHIGNCKGPCEGLQKLEEYDEDIAHVHHILKGNLGVVRNYFKDKMNTYANNLEFEKAHSFKEKLDLVERFQSKSLVVNPAISDLEVFTIVSDENTAYVNFLKVIQGSITQTLTREVKRKLDEPENEILLMTIIEVRELLQSTSKEVITNIPVDTTIEKFNITVPQIGDKRKLIALSLKNALYYKKEKSEEIINNRSEDASSRILTKLGQDLRMNSLPMTIECFDNSNIQGTNPVSSMVCFKNGRPSKKDYRHYNIRSVEGPNDFASMYEVVYRRYKRILSEEQPLPDLIVVDGGKGQLSMAVDALKALEIYGRVPIIGIAKRLEELYFPDDSIPLHIDKKSESLRLLQRIRDEAHRFAINFHRDKRSKAGLKSQLEGVKGIGKETINKLLSTYKTIQRIKETDVEEVGKLIGMDRARKLLIQLNPKENE